MAPGTEMLLPLPGVTLTVAPAPGSAPAADGVSAGVSACSSSTTGMLFYGSAIIYPIIETESNQRYQLTMYHLHLDFVELSQNQE